MGELNINDLPYEILTKVFRYLDGRNLNNATVTCKLWNELIESGCRRKLELRYNWDGDEITLCAESSEDSEQKLNFVLSTNRKFGTIEVVCGDLSGEMLKIFEKHGFNVVKLIMDDCSMRNLVAFADLLNLTPNLTHADVNGTYLDGVSDAPLDQALPDVKNLKTLEIDHIDYRIIKCFRKAKLTTMKICQRTELSDHTKILIDFLLSQDILTSLTATHWSTLILAEMGELVVRIPFRLTRLVISDRCGELSPLNQAKLLKFVKSQAENLTELEIAEGIPNSIYECIFTSMPKLNTLRVDMCQIPVDNDFYERLEENRSVRTIKLMGFVPTDLEFIGNFFEKLPNIRSLFLEASAITLTAMAHHLSKIESLSIRSIGHWSSKTSICAHLPNLKVLDVESLTAEIDWNEFTKMHSKLTELTIQRITEEWNLTSDDIDQMTTNVDLQSIRLGVGFVADDRFFEIVRTKCKNLKVLDLHQSCLSDELRNDVDIGVLRLYDDISVQHVFSWDWYE